MDVRVPKELTPGQRRRAEKWAESVALDQLEHQGRVLLDTFIKIICIIMHDVFGWGEKRLLLLLGQLRGIFLQQQKLVKEGKQMEYLNRRMEEIFKTKGFPQGFFDKMLGSVETAEQERNGANVLNDSPVDCQTESVTESQREEREKNDEQEKAD